MELVLDRLGRGAVIGHRGYPQVYPENTIASFVAALKAGADFVELDVQRTVDDQIVVFHDNSLKRLLRLDSNISGMTWNALRTHRIDGHGIPTLASALKAISRFGEGAGVLIEIKHPADTQYVLDVVKESGMKGRVAIISFHGSALSIDAGIPTGLLYMRRNRKIEFAGINGSEIILPQYKHLTRSSVEKAHMLGLKVVTWTVDTKEEMENAWMLGVDGIITDNPKLGRETFELLRR
ncbi:MAG: glycerophosphodiester phosphodiesterase [Candidatus Micrarchaeales archaeon]|jgi:glycerophosphoryl diester phosphodiesterase|uniref:Glycerophosphoryl diester phosphodiesterase n=1 Tax=Candidatus Micrarchaeum acidiphilum ARMAN-2 TaxID=425595 RepID=C7DHE1_MICA2|nr:MAG: glycerophosphoryl diester phosphodiesterase [Candidatus Micrarchaeum acidiphilum ARMAN-2]MCW6160611.1 glycerophosphodiester phosphodiesterase [Candidatus Micrarchaeales archaeon]